MFTHDTESGKKKLSHIAFIMDGNGRWAKKRLLPREAGHVKGAKTFVDVAEYCFKGGIDTVTAYAFSTENWSRPKGEVDAIMTLLETYIKQGIRDMTKKNVRVKFLGDKSPFSKKLQDLMEGLERDSRNNKYALNIAVNYGGRAELVAAVNRLAARGVNEFTEDLISSEIYTAGQPDPDLIVRSAGEMRLSNFLMWQSVYSEFYFSDTLWPDFGEKEVDAAVAAYYTRSRRYGGI